VACFYFILQRIFLKLVVMGSCIMRKNLLLSAFLLLCAALALLGLLGAWPCRAADDADIIAPGQMDACLECHGESVSMERLASSAHGKLNCQSCHAGVDRFPHPEQAIARAPDCVGCHTGGKEGPNWRMHHAGKKTADCASCHGGKAHEIAVITAGSPAQQQAACKPCHAATLNELRKSAHNPANLDCFGCHGAKGKAAAPAPGDAMCDRCHHDIAKVVGDSVHAGAGTKKSGCLACHGKSGHRVSMPRWGTPEQQQATCTNCHAGVQKKMQVSVHGSADGRGMSLKSVD